MRPRLSVSLGKEVVEKSQNAMAAVQYVLAHRDAQSVVVIR